MNTESKRIEKCTIVSNTLACMSNQQLQQVLSTGKEMHAGIGGTSVRIDIENIPVFVKRVPITEFELKPDNFMSTANIFKLPMCYQYGIGSAGFSAWRELAAHIMTTNWVISGQCPNFPMMYSWRIISNSLSKTDLSYWESTEKYLDYWENNPNIKERIHGLNSANTSVLLFLEHFPRNLHQHLKEVLSSNISELDSINHLEKLNKSFGTALEFMQKKGFLHMDAHFHNILADEDDIYLSDFGLALSKKFDLSMTEHNFVKDHEHYDRCSYSVNLLHAVLTAYAGKEHWDKTLSDYLTNKFSIKLPNKINEILSINAHIAEKMHTFYKEIQKDKSTPYPSNHMKEMLEILRQREIL
ncbi:MULTISPECIES: protein kinase [Legionellaceae]|uniref:Protein kinase domain-containing protein n=2 Tax=Legionellaceae TaxID=444 RepID=A0A1E5JP72_9GAMM|nr:MULTISPECIES: protein kinase [Legionellaceae]KTD41947.1 Protein kinase domain protein [Legionella parisiensis]MCW8418058.1 protein kinase [Fluoribacter dumoffii]MCW8454100.1 protein kinase [Fluoribacter dumoffii]MCW8482042.1 protein kinase [Fluoribacter dumoffii]MDX1794053.1 protein kinase [Legionella pneumophila]